MLPVNYRSAKPAFELLRQASLTVINHTNNHNYGINTDLWVDFLSLQKLLAAILLQKKSLMQVLAANISMNFYCKNCLRVFSAITGKPIQMETVCRKPKIETVSPILAELTSYSDSC